LEVHLDFDPEAKIGYGYVPNRQDTYFMDPRDIALRKAMYCSIGETDLYHGWVQIQIAK